MLLLYMILMAMTAHAQSTQDFQRKYNLLVAQVGPGGVGVETLLDNWSKVDHDNPDMLMAKFNCYLTKAQSTEIITKDVKKYLGTDPVLSLKDSTGTDINYFQVLRYDDELFGQAISALDRAIALYPRRLEYRFLKANAYMSYEQESPDMALSNLLALINDYSSDSEGWTYDSEVVDEDFFTSAIQEYCVTLHSLATPSAYEALKKLSEKMLEKYPDRHMFRTNIGTYHLLVLKDYKGAIRQYGQVLKKVPDDYTSIINSVLAARQLKNKKLEIKYLQMLLKHGTEKDRLHAQARLKALQTK